MDKPSRRVIMQDPSSEQRGVAIHDPAADMRGPEAQDDGVRSDGVAAGEATAQCGPMPAPGDARLPAACPDASRRAGSVTGGVRWLMQLEGLLLCICAGQAYAWLTGDLILLLVLFFVPDLSVLGYLFGRRVGVLLQPGAFIDAALAGLRRRHDLQGQLGTWTDAPHHGLDLPHRPQSCPRLWIEVRRRLPFHAPGIHRRPTGRIRWAPTDGDQRL